jgi:hypothetical protein
MMSRRKFRKGLPSPLEVAFYLLAVIAFCVINWALLKAGRDEAEKPVVKSFENMVVEAMLDELEPVTKAKNANPAPNVLDFGVSRDHALTLETWMVSPEAFRKEESEPALTVEDWMISTSSWLED